MDRRFGQPERRAGAGASIASGLQQGHEVPAEGVELREVVPSHGRLGLLEDQRRVALGRGGGHARLRSPDERPDDPPDPQPSWRDHLDEGGVQQGLDDLERRIGDPSEIVGGEGAVESSRRLHRGAATVAELRPAGRDGGRDRAVRVPAGGDPSRDLLRVVQAQPPGGELERQRVPLQRRHQARDALGVGLARGPVAHQRRARLSGQAGQPTDPSALHPDARSDQAPPAGAGPGPQERWERGGCCLGVIEHQEALTAAQRPRDVTVAVGHLQRAAHQPDDRVRVSGVRQIAADRLAGPGPGNLVEQPGLTDAGRAGDADHRPLSRQALEHPREVLRPAEPWVGAAHLIPRPVPDPPPRLARPEGLELRRLLDRDLHRGRRARYQLSAMSRTKARTSSRTVPGDPPSRPKIP
jgi:hypothetical protein